MPNPGLSKEPVKQILHHCIKKENNYVTPKNIRFGEREPIRDILIPASTSVSVSILSHSQEASMPDLEASEPKKIVERKKYLQFENVLKESMSTTTITKRILD